MGKIVALLLSIAAEMGIPPYFALSIALTENPTLDPLAVHINSDGSRDLGIMQLHDSWYRGNWQDPETNIRAGCGLIKWLMCQPGITTWWDVAAAYNCGLTRFRLGPPAESLKYANQVIEKWNHYR
jgi:soluble lytic murein transglycosylase-like protein